jgi:beta-xylosidase
MNEMVGINVEIERNWTKTQQRENTFVKEKTTTKNTAVMVKAKVKEQELSEHEKTVNELKERFGMLNPM